MTDDAFLPGPGVPGLVSVVVPTYQRAHVVAETIDSILAQTYANVEAIVIDDGSTDRTRAEVMAYQDARVRYFHQENRGLSAARNAALRQARGAYIAFLDSDDAWVRWKLEAQLAILRRHPDVGLVCSDMSACSTTGTLLEERYLRSYYTAFERVDIVGALSREGTLADLMSNPPPRYAGAPYYVGNFFDLMYVGNFVHPSTAVVTRERLRLAGEYEPQVTRGGAEDYHFYLKVSQHGPAAFLDVPTTLYSIGDPGQISADVLAESRGNMTVLTHWLGRHTPSLPPTVIRQRLSGAHAWVGREAIDGGAAGESTRHLWASLRIDPFQPRVALFLVMSLLPAPVRRLVRATLRRVRRLVGGSRNPPG